MDKQNAFNLMGKEFKKYILNETCSLSITVVNDNEIMFIDTIKDIDLSIQNNVSFQKHDKFSFEY